MAADQDFRRGWLALGFKVLLLLLINQIQWSTVVGVDPGTICAIYRYRSHPELNSFKIGIKHPTLEAEVKRELMTYYELIPLEWNSGSRFEEQYAGGFPALKQLLSSKDPAKEPFPVRANSFSEIFDIENSVVDSTSISDGTKIDCAPHKCGFDIKESFQFICSDKLLGESFDQRNKTLVKDKALPNGYLCNAASVGRFGMEYNEKNPDVIASSEQLRRSKIFERLKDKGDKLIAGIEKANIENCEDRNCKFSKDKHAFICGGQRRSTIPMATSVVAIGLFLGIGSLPV